MMVEDGARRWRDSAWFDVVVIVATVAAGTVVAGVLNDYGAGEPVASTLGSPGKAGPILTHQRRPRAAFTPASLVLS